MHEIMYVQHVVIVKFLNQIKQVVKPVLKLVLLVVLLVLAALVCRAALPPVESIVNPRRVTQRPWNPRRRRLDYVDARRPLDGQQQGTGHAS